MSIKFRDRRSAGRLLAGQLLEYAKRDDVLVLALPRGGVPVAAEIARALHLPMDILLVRKLALPEQPELAVGAISSGGVCVLNEEVLAGCPVPAGVLASVTTFEQAELARRERLYRGGRPFPNVQGRTVILVDDGIATGTSLRAALELLKRQGAKQIVIAVPVAPARVCAEFRQAPDCQLFTCLLAPEPFYAVSEWYDDFTQTTDEEVCELLRRAAVEKL